MKFAFFLTLYVCGLRILAGLVLHTSQPQTLGRTTGSFHNIASALTHSVDMLYCLLRWILKRQYRKVDSPIHYKASRITFSWDTVELWEIQYAVFLGMETVWPRLANSHRLCTYSQQKQFNTQKEYFVINRGNFRILNLSDRRSSITTQTRNIWLYNL